MDTIFALATARGRSGVAVFRISGPDALSIGANLAGDLPRPGKISLRTLRDQANNVIDEALVLSFLGPRSFTGEDVVELQTHGSPAVIASIERILSTMYGARPAEAGEFTRRALENDRLDLAQVEGLGELLSAETEAQRQQAVRLMSGRLGDRAAEWTASLLRASALIEATIDFADEDVPVDVMPEVKELLVDVRASLAAEIDGSRVAERIKDGFDIAIVGAPNAGKSSLINYIAGRDLAITSTIPGTTRDVLELQVDLGGLPVTFLDTAGIRDSEDEIEQIGVSRARRRADEADLRIWLTDDGSEVAPVELKFEDITVSAKADLTGSDGISGITGQGVDALLDKIQTILSNRAQRVMTATTQRHRQSMVIASDALDTALARLEEGQVLPELFAEDLRSAVRSLDSLTGCIDVEAILGEIFSSFCIGK